MICTRIGPYLYQPQWVASRRDIYAKTLKDKGMPVANVIGFIDGTRFRISFPTVNQRPYYSGYTGHHDLLYIAIVFPDGSFTIGSACMQGSFNDVKALQCCGFDQEGLTNLTTEMYFIGGDSIFSSRTNQRIITPQSYESLDDRLAFTSCRVSVEWLFGILKELFPYLCSWKKQEICKHNFVHNRVVTAFVLVQALNTFQPNIISQHFRLDAPQLESIFPLHIMP